MPAKLSENKTLAEAFTLLLLLLTLLSCASEIQHSNRSGRVAEKQGEEQKQKSPMPIITYRPGG
jgi:hypothetical protein